MFALGHLVSVNLKNGLKVTFDETQNLLVYDGDTKDLLITVPVSEEGAAVPDSDYQQFHAEAQGKLINVDWFPPSKKHTINCGLIYRINYYVPAHFNSVKKDKEYKHAFGDMGDRYVPPGIACLPMLRHDTKRNWYYIQRRPQNKWTVDDYIRG